MSKAVQLEYLGLPWRVILEQPTVVGSATTLQFPIEGFDWWLIRFLTGNYTNANAAGDSIICVAEKGIIAYQTGVIPIPAAASQLGGFTFGINGGMNEASVAQAELTASISESFCQGDGLITLQGGSIGTTVQMDTVRIMLWAWRTAWGKWP